ncbi:MAG: NAD(P)H-hydrate dehydratase [Candidatus Bathyarchaeota archaeon]
MGKEVTAEEMVALEKNAEYLGVSMEKLMECAGWSVAREITSKFDINKKCVVFVGPGRNGGDGMVASRHLASSGFEITTILVGNEEKITDATVMENWNALKQLKSTVKTIVTRDSSELPEISSDIVIDALLGIGVKGNIQPPILQAVRKVNEADTFCVAVDIPTGIEATSGEVLGEAVKANLTVTFHKPKTGLAKAKEYTGDISVADIGIPLEAETYTGPGDILLARKQRPSASHKGDFGRLLIIGGNETFVGAPALAGMAGLQTGVDLVYVAAPKQVSQAISSFSPSLITIKLNGDHIDKENISLIQTFMNRTTAVVIGPGLGVHRDTVEAIRNLLDIAEKLKKPLVLDADALKIFGELEHSLKGNCILTPHAEEYKLLTGESLPTDFDKRVAQIKKTAKEKGVVILLKGNVDIITDGDRVKLNLTGNAGMTAGGTGDTLAGAIGGFMAQGIDAFRAGVAGAFINGAAGDIVYAKKGYHILPTDIINELPKVIESPMSHKDTRMLRDLNRL